MYKSCKLWALLLMQNSCCSMRKAGQIIWIFPTRVSYIFFAGQKWSRVYSQFKGRESITKLRENFWMCSYEKLCWPVEKPRSRRDENSSSPYEHASPVNSGTKLFRQNSFAFATRRPLSQHSGQNGIIFVLCVFPTDFVNQKL